MALLVGNIDPISYLDRAGYERVITDAVVKRAWELRVQEAQARAPEL